MGKGGTRFVQESVAKFKGTSGSERRKLMQDFLETGAHPEAEERRFAQRETAAVPLPEYRKPNDHIFIEFAFQGAKKEKVLIELFTRECPEGSRYMKSRCHKGSETSISGLSVSSVIKGHCLKIDAPKGKLACIAKGEPSLCHTEPYLVSIPQRGHKVHITFSEAPGLDGINHVVGRLCKGEQVLKAIESCSVAVDDKPTKPITVSDCGVASSEFSVDETGGTASLVSPEELKKKTAAISKGIKRSVKEGLDLKRTRDDAHGKAKKFHWDEMSSSSSSSESD
mmetsp:Transcript_8230/g.21221  ORF Transcript_8230/g.21221 Transcript_8230/m.21221 type:complete len:282 (-) Transcript_8230:986-1831(-)